MSFASTQITVVGKIVTDIETRVTQMGHKVADFRLASQERNYDKEQDLWVDGNRMYLTVVCWRNIADHVTESLRKGDQVVVHGRMRIRVFLSREGVQRTDLEVEAKAIGPDLSLHTVTVNRLGWPVSPNQQELLSPTRADPAPADDRTEGEVVQAA
jgi:single-strand DNA-binding protein